MSRAALSVLDQLFEGNERHYSGLQLETAAGRASNLAAGQSPIATIITCADSRVAPEITFDQAQGRLFVIRNAGNILDTATVASVEFAVGVLETPVVLVVGHTHCGAVEAACDGVTFDGALGEAIDKVRDALTLHDGGSCTSKREAEALNARRVAEALPRASAVVAGGVHAGKTLVLPAVYDLETGRVKLVDANAQLVDAREARSSVEEIATGGPR